MPMINESRLPESPATREELDARLAQTREILGRRGVDALVVTDPRGVYWLTSIWLGWFKTAPAVIVTESGYAVVARLLDNGWEEVWSGRTWAQDWTYYRDEDDIAVVVGRGVKALAGAGRRVGIELQTDYVEGRFAATLQAEATIAECVDVTADLADIRSVKSPSELALIRLAGAITATGMDTVRSLLSAGSTDAEAAAAAFTAMVDAGSGMFFVGPLVAAGPVNRGVHVPWANTRPEHGEPVTAMMAAIFRGYGCPLERTFFRGEIPAGALSQLTSAADAIDHVLAEIRVGMTGRDVDELIRASHRRSGLADRYLHRGGYSIGINWSDLALVQMHPGEERTIREGMTFHLVPHLMDPDLGLMCVSQPIVVRAEGAEKLVDYPLIGEPV